MNPRKIAEQMEDERRLKDGAGERFSGYAVMGVSFDSGHVLAMRRFPAASIGSAYSSVWVRDPSGQWTFYQSAPPELACSRYFGRAVSRIVHSPIEIEWTSSHAFNVRVREVNLRWRVTLEETLRTRALNALVRHVPDSVWRNEKAVDVVGRAASVLLRTGRLPLAGQVPNGQAFLVNPRMVWLISRSEAVLQDEDLGATRRLEAQIKIDNYWIPQRGLFVLGDATMEARESSRGALL